jgi:mannose-6-phosphate isomerase-like protein (cupin superfamily)
MQEGISVATLDLDGGERFQLLRRELGVSAFGLNLLRLRPRQRGRIHRHEHQEEVYIVLEGTLTLSVEGEDRTFPRGSAVRVAPSLRRQLANRGSEPLVVLAVGGSEPHEGRDGLAYSAWDETEGRPPPEVPLPADLDD